MKNIFVIVAIFVFVSAGIASDTEKNVARSSATSDIQDTPSETVEVHSDMRFGRIVRVQGNIATVQIISKIRPSQIEPKFLACDIKLNPVAELESMHTGFNDCFLFKIVRGVAEKGDNVIVRYYAIKRSQKKD